MPQALQRLAIALSCLLLISCAGVAGHVRASGDVEVWTDGTRAVAVGDGVVSAGLYQTGADGGALYALPTWTVGDGLVLVVNRSTGELARLPHGAPLPSWVRELVPPEDLVRAELEVLEE